MPPVFKTSILLTKTPTAFSNVNWVVEFSEMGLRRLSLQSGKSSQTQAKLPAAVSKMSTNLKRLLQARLQGENVDLEWSAFDLNDTAPFHLKIWQAMRTIPFGETATYGEVAGIAGSPLAFRACGQACNANRILIFIPCHRVVAANGLGGFGYGLDWKRKLLALETK